MAWSDYFLPDGSLGADDQAALYAKTQADLNRKLLERQRNGTISVEQSDRYSLAAKDTLEDQNAAALAGAAEGAAEGLSNVLNFPGKVVDTAGKGLSQIVGGILKGVPWWLWLVAAGALFFYMGGAALLRGRLAK